MRVKAIMPLMSDMGGVPNHLSNEKCLRGSAASKALDSKESDFVESAPEPHERCASHHCRHQAMRGATNVRLRLDVFTVPAQKSHSFRYMKYMAWFDALGFHNFDLVVWNFAWIFSNNNQMWYGGKIKWIKINFDNYLMPNLNSIVKQFCMKFDLRFYIIIQLISNIFFPKLHDL